MQPLATVQDLERRWRELTDAERARAEVELADASAFVLSRMRQSGVSIDPTDELQAANIVSVTCSMAKRSLAPQFENTSSSTVNPSAPITAYKQTADVFSEEFSFANPMGDRYLTGQEEKLLGIGSMRFKVIPALSGGCHVRRSCNS